MSITESNTTRYLRELADKKSGERYKALEEFASQKFIPIIHKEAADTLLYFIRTEQPRRILELGTAMGYSSIRMAEAVPGATVDTIERDPDMLKLARANVAAYGLTDRIHILAGDIDDVILTLSGPYDFIFIDAGKSHYQAYLERSLEIISPGGLIICDNVLVRGLIAQEGVQRKHSTIIWNMRGFLEDVSLDNRFHSMVLPVGDGLLIIKLKE